jgi:recombinational DNA repair ATPase RecF
MTPFRIKSAEVYGGPLSRGFVLEQAKGFNLIYGLNEKGKTTIVEALIKWLFGTGNKLAWSKDELRGIAVTGKVCVQGNDRETVVELSGATKISDRFGAWLESAGLPPDLSKLLVVRSGESQVTSGTGDGVGGDLVRKYLAGSGMLNEVLGPMPAVARKESTRIAGGLVQGNKQGIIKEQNNLNNQLCEITDLLEEVRRRTGGPLKIFARKVRELEDELESQETAQCFYAWQISGQVKRIQEKLLRYPSSDALNAAENRVLQLRGKEGEAIDIDGKLSGMTNDVENHSWVQQALPQYEEFISREGQRSRWPLFVGALAFVLTVVGGFLGQKFLLIAGTVLVLVFAAIHYLLSSRQQQLSPGELSEIEVVKKEFGQRFGQALTGLAMLRAKLEELSLVPGRRQALTDQLASLGNECAKTSAEISSWFGTNFSGVAEPENWERTIGLIRKERSKQEQEITSLDKTLASLGVAPERYIELEQKVKYNSDRVAELNKELIDIKGEIEELETAETELKQKVVAKVGQPAGSWLELVNLLESKLDEAEHDYREKTARLLAMICVRDVASELREIEHEEIADNFRDEKTLGETLSRLTNGAYSHFEWEDQMVKAISQGGVGYALNNLSKGAQEQALLALRISFARRALGNRPAFLILDDAFQHADWKRRSGMIQATLQLVKQQGWQVFYFTMDDDIRDRYKKAADEILGPEGSDGGCEWKYIELE